MLFHVTMSHTPENCPACDPEKMKEAMAAGEKMESVAKELNIKVHFMVTEVVGHTVYGLVETDNPDSLARFFGGIPFPQDVKATPVEPLQQMIARSKEMMAQQR